MGMLRKRHSALAGGLALALLAACAQAQTTATAGSAAQAAQAHAAGQASGGQQAQDDDRHSPLDDLPWQRGPVTVKLGGNATFKVPQGYAFLGPEGARQFDRLTHNPPPKRDEYLIAKEDFSWIAFFAYEPIGYVKDDEKLDADELLKSITEGTEASNEERKRQGWSPAHVSGWAFKPQYDGTLKSLEWAFKLRGEASGHETVNYNTRLLGRHGVMEVLVLTQPEDLQTAVADFKRQLPAFSFNAGETYGEYRSGDKVAEYGLAALVTGGAIAVAAKKGLFASLGLLLLKLWKLVLVGLAAVGAGVRKLFGRGGDGDRNKTVR